MAPDYETTRRLASQASMASALYRLAQRVNELSAEDFGSVEKGVRGLIELLQAQLSTMPDQSA
jgi:hypothetical protein